MKKILIIGGAGYIGSHVVKELCDLKHDVTVLDNLSTGLRSNVDKRAKFIKADILDYDILTKKLKGFDIIFHFAALKNAGISMHDTENYSMNNITGTINILNAMVKNNINKIIFSSSAAVYGTPRYTPLDENHPLNPENFYGFTKLEIERILSWYSKLKSIRFAALRYFNAAGYGTIEGLEQNPGNLIPIIMEVAINKRKYLEVYGNDYDTKDGTGIRDYIHVLDLADAHIKAMDYIINNDKDLIINLASEQGHSVLDIIKATEKIIKKKIPYKIVPRRAGDPAIVVATAKLAYKVLGWKAKYSDIDNIISTTWNVYKKSTVKK
jgi:UDP-glucose 4-epimerase